MAVQGPEVGDQVIQTRPLPLDHICGRLEQRREIARGGVIQGRAGLVQSQLETLVALAQDASAGQALQRGSHAPSLVEQNRVRVSERQWLRPGWVRFFSFRFSSGRIGWEVAGCVFMRSGSFIAIGTSIGHHQCVTASQQGRAA